MAANGGPSEVANDSTWEQDDGPITNLPDSILLDIFTRVEDAKSLVFCSCACKSWHRKVRDVERVTIISPRHFKTYWDKIMDVVDKVHVFPSLVKLRVRFGCANDTTSHNNSDGSLSLADMSGSSSLHVENDSTPHEGRAGTNWRQRVQRENEEQWKRCLRYAEMGTSVDKFIFLAARAAHPAIFRCAMSDSPPAAEVARMTERQPSASSPHIEPASPFGLAPRVGRLSLSDWPQDATPLQSGSPFGDVTETFDVNSARSNHERESLATLGGAAHPAAAVADPAPSPSPPPPAAAAVDDPTSPATPLDAAPSPTPPPLASTVPSLTAAVAPSAVANAAAAPAPPLLPPPASAPAAPSPPHSRQLPSRVSSQPDIAMLATDDTTTSSTSGAAAPACEEPLPEEPSSTPSPDGGFQLHLRQVMGPRDDSLRRMMPVIVFAIIRCFDELRDVLPCLLLKLPRLAHLLLVDPSDNVTINVRSHHIKQLRAGKQGMGLAGDEDATSAAASATSSLANSVLETDGENESDAQRGPTTATSAAARAPRAQQGFTFRAAAATAAADSENSDADDTGTTATAGASAELISAISPADGSGATGSGIAAAAAIAGVDGIRLSMSSLAGGGSSSPLVPSADGGSLHPPHNGAVADATTAARGEADSSASAVLPLQHNSNDHPGGSETNPGGIENFPHHHHGCTGSAFASASSPSPSLFQFPTQSWALQHPPSPPTTSSSSSSQPEAACDPPPSRQPPHHSRSRSTPSPRHSPARSPRHSPLRSPPRAPIATIPLPSALDPSSSSSLSSPLSSSSEGPEFNVSIWRSEQVLLGGPLQVHNMSVCVASTEPRQLSHEDMEDLGRVAVGGRLLEATLRFLAAHAPAHGI